MLAPMVLRPSSLALAAALAACHPVSPPPLIPMHAGTAPRAVDATTVTVVVGVAGELFGGEGWGVAVRAERQVGEDTAAGLQLGGGRGKEGEGKDGAPLRHWLVEVRGYGRLGSVDRDWVAGLASFGVSTMDTGLVATTLAVGASVSYPNRYAVPALGVFGAVSVPWRRGGGFGPAGDRYTGTTWWLGGSAAIVVPVGDTGNAPSVEVGTALGFGPDESAQLSASVADSHTFGPD